MPKVVNCRKAKTAPMMTGKQEIDDPPVRIDDDIGIHTDQGAKVEAAGKDLGSWCRYRVCTIEILDDFLKHDRKTECHKDLISMGSLVEILDQAAFHEQANQRHDRN
jgi:hypothetical protein